MKQVPSRETIIEVLQSNDRLYKAAKSFGVTSPTLRKWMDKRGVTMDYLSKENSKIDSKRLRFSWIRKLFHN